MLCADRCTARTRPRAVRPARNLVQILQLNRRPVFLEQPDTGTLNFQDAASHLRDCLNRSAKVAGDDGIASCQFKQPSLMFLE